MSQPASAGPSFPPFGPLPPPLGGVATAGWGLLAMFAWILAQLAVVFGFSMWWAGSHPGDPLTPDRLQSNGHLLCLTLIVGTLVQLAVLFSAIGRTRWPIDQYLAFHRPHPRGIVRGLIYVAILLIAFDLIA